MMVAPLALLQRFLFPVPLAYASTLAAISAVAAVMTGLQINDWAYVSLSHLSGMPRESITYAGPISAAAACYLAGNLFEGRSPVSSAATPRRDNRLLISVATVFAASAVVGHVLGAGILLAQYAPRAAAGTINWLELCLGPLQLVPLVLLGVVFALGGTRWWLPLLSLVISLFWILILPILAGTFLPSYTYSVGHEFFYPATPAYRHEDYVLNRLVLVFVFWILVSAVLVVIAHLTARRQGALPMKITLLGPVLLPLIGISAWMSVDESMFYSTFPESNAVCDTQEDWTYCVMPEEADLFAEFVGEASYVQAQSKTLGKPPRTVLSSGLSTSQWQAPTTAGEIITAGISDVRGVENVKNDVAGALAGLSRCDFNYGGPSDGPVIAAWGLTLWLAGDPYHVETNPFTSQLDELTDSEREQWLIENEQRISTCTIDYDG